MGRGCLPTETSFRGASIFVSFILQISEAEALHLELRTKFHPAPASLNRKMTALLSNLVLLVDAFSPSRSGNALS